MKLPRFLVALVCALSLNMGSAFSASSNLSTQSSASTVFESDADSGTSSIAVPEKYFGMTIAHWLTPFPDEPIGGIRLLGTLTKWGDINSARGVYDWTTLDAWLDYVAPNNGDVIYTFLGVPAWAATDPTLRCNHWSGACSPPSDLNDDGTGTDQIFKDFVTAIAQHAGTQITHWEIWNEPNIPSGGTSDDPYGSWNGTQAQLVRMANDARTIVLKINPKAKFLTPSPNPGNGKGVAAWMGLYLAAGGGQYADIIAFHGYVLNPEDVTPIITDLKSTLTEYGQNGKPVWDTEASWGAKIDYPDPDMRASFVARMYLLQWPYGVSHFYWFAWDYLNSGTLWEDNSDNGCTTPGSGGYLCASGVAYGQVSSWMLGATVSSCSANGTVWTCSLTRSGGYDAQVVWDAAQSCSNGTCTTSTYNVPSKYINMVDLSGNQQGITGSTIAIGVKPVLLINQ